MQPLNHALTICTNVITFVLMTSCQTTNYHRYEKIGHLPPVLTETSGLCFSYKNKSTYWAINDSENKAEVYALSHHGNLLKSFLLEETINNDWEAICSFQEDHKSFLCIADIGDNLKKRENITLLIFPEPDLHLAKQIIKSSEIHQTKIKYANGPRDAESLTFCPQSKCFYLISKEKSAKVYQIPLNDIRKNQSLEPALEITCIPRPSEDDLKHPYGHVWSNITDIAINHNGSKLILLTYKNAYLFQRKNHENWIDTIKKGKPQTIFLIHPTLNQMLIREALTFDQNDNILITSEEKHAPLFKWLK